MHGTARTTTGNTWKQTAQEYPLSVRVFAIFCHLILGTVTLDAGLGLNLIPWWPSEEAAKICALIITVVIIYSIYRFLFSPPRRQPRLR